MDFSKADTAKNEQQYGFHVSKVLDRRKQRAKELLNGPEIWNVTRIFFEKAVK
jgi:hypothetical protein